MSPISGILDCQFVFDSLSFGECTISKPQVQLWYNRLKEGQEDVDDDKTDENIKVVKKMIRNNRWITIREVADDVGISCQSIVTVVLGMKRAAAKIVLKLLKITGVRL